MGEIWRQISLALQVHRRHPTLTLVIVVSLVLGIGVNTAVLSLVDMIFLRPLPIEDPERLVTVYRTQRTETGQYTGMGLFSYSTYLDLQARSRTLREVAAYAWTPVNLSGGSEPLRATAMFVDGGYFRTLGVEPAHGRFFTPDEADQGSPGPVAVVSHGTWVRLFGSDPDLVGRTVQLNGRPFEVAGIGPAAFRGTEFHVDVDVWVPTPIYREIGPAAEWFDGREIGNFSVFGRLAPSVSRGQAAQELNALSRQLEAEYPVLEEGAGASVAPLLEGVLPVNERSDYVAYAQVLCLAGVLVLLLSCLNVGVLLLVRGLERRQELALRQVLGAPRRRIFRQLAGENLLLFAVGSVLSLPLAVWTLGLLWKFRPPRLTEGAIEAALDLDMLLWTGATAALAALVFGAGPAWRTGRMDLVSEIRDTSGAASRGRTSFRSGDLLVVGQVALATVALAGGALFVNHFLDTRRIDLGFDAENLAVVSLAPGDQGYEDGKISQLYENLKERVRALPGVEAAALSENRLLRGAVYQQQVFLEGSTEPASGGGRLYHRIHAVNPGFLFVAVINLLRGRDSDAGDRAGSPPVVIINRAMAELAWPGEDPLGKRIHLADANEPTVEVVAIAEDAKYRYVDEDPQFFLYVPIAQVVPGSATLHVRTATSPEQVLPALARTVWDVDPSLPVADLATMEAFLGEAFWRERSAALFLAGMAGLALVVVVIGIHGVMTYSVRRRLHEFGIQISLGAERSRILRQVLRQTGLRVGLGLVVGLTAVVLVLRPVAAGLVQEIGSGMTGLVAGLTGLLVVLGALRPALLAVRWKPSVLLRGA